MAKKQIEPAKIFEHADCFLQSLAVLRAVHPENIHIAVTLAEPLTVLSALTTELFLKCLICIETGGTPRGHNLKRLFDQLSVATRTRIQNLWDSGVAARRSKQWDDFERFWHLETPHDLPSALAKGGPAFESHRYSYEENTEGVYYYVGDLPALLEGLILEMKPEFEPFRRMPLPLPAPYH